MNTRLLHVIYNGKSRLARPGFSTALGAAPPVGELVESLLLARVPHLRSKRVLLCPGTSRHRSGFLHYSLNRLYDFSPYMEPYGKNRQLHEQIESGGAFTGWSIRVIGNACLDPCLHWRDMNADIDEKPEWCYWRPEHAVIEIIPPKGESFYFISDHFADNAHNRDDIRAFFAFTETSLPTFQQFIMKEFALWHALDKLADRNPEREIEFVNTMSSNLTVSNDVSWDRIIMSDHVRRGVYDDFEFFRKNKDWYEKNNMPWSRGYLLCGPPGNGKSLLTKAIAMTKGFLPFIFDISDDESNDPYDFYAAFKRIRQNAPAVLIFEDFDRVFDETRKKKIPLEVLLSCFDGMSTNRGVVLVATANHPEWIDEAFKNRPGRFDQVIHIDNPDRTLRHKMLYFLFHKSNDSRVTDEALEKLAEKTDGFSMVQLKELFLQAGQGAFRRKSSEIHDKDAHEAWERVSTQFNHASKAGFGRNHHG